jgi:hypothetical protein
MTTNTHNNEWANIHKLTPPPVPTHKYNKRANTTTNTNELNADAIPQRQQ